MGLDVLRTFQNLRGFASILSCHMHCHLEPRLSSSVSTAHTFPVPAKDTRLCQALHKAVRKKKLLTNYYVADVQARIAKKLAAFRRQSSETYKAYRKNSCSCLNSTTVVSTTYCKIAFIAKHESLIWTYL